MDSANNSDSLTAAYIDGAAVIRINGRGSFKISPPLKQFITRVIETGSASRILVDMSACTGMDSTFMGVIAGLSYRIKNTRIGFKLVRLSEKNCKLLTTLGVDRVVNFSSSTSPEEKNLLEGRTGEALPLETTPTEAAQTTLEAHEALVEVDPTNLVKFESVIELLQKDLQSMQKKNDT